MAPVSQPPSSGSPTPAPVPPAPATGAGKGRRFLRAAAAAAAAALFVLGLYLAARADGFGDAFWLRNLPRALGYVLRVQFTGQAPPPRWQGRPADTGQGWPETKSIPTGLRNLGDRARSLEALGLLALLCALPSVRRNVARGLSKVRHPTPRARRRAALAVGLVAAAYLLFTARRQGRDFTMRVQDEMMYLVQAQMMAHGRLALPPHPHPDFFEELLIFSRPVYAAIYFPGTALFYAPAVRLHLPLWLPPIAVCGTIVALMYRLLSELIDGVAGLLGALLMLSLWVFRYLSIMVMSHTLLILLGLLMTWAYLRWRRPGARRPAWAILFGALAGWAAVTRPLDAICFAAPLALAFLLDLRGRPWREKLAAYGLMALAAAPLLSIQLAMDKSVTGRWLLTPVQLYHQTYWPEMALGPRDGGAPIGRHVLPTALPQFQSYYERFVVKQARIYRDEERLADRLPFALHFALPSHALIVLLPLGVLGLTDRRRRAVWAVLPLFMLAYGFFLFFLRHYVMVAAPAVILGVLLGAHALEEIFPRARHWLSAFLTLAVAGFALTGLPEVFPATQSNPARSDQPSLSPVLQQFNRSVPSLEKPALVFFRYHPEQEEGWRNEQTYNIDAPGPDESPVARAQDLGPRNIELVRHYAALQPARVVYRYDQKTCKLTRLGTAQDLAARGIVPAGE